MTTAIVDYGSGNLRSAEKAFLRTSLESGRGAPITVTADPEVVARSERIVLPGVGAFADCRAGLLAVEGMAEAIEERIAAGHPFLGICVGMQLMASRGLEHGETPGFGWIAGEVVRLSPADPALKVPHMGWNALDFEEAAHPLLAGITRGAHAYFVHSYHFRPEREAHILAQVEHGERVAAIVGEGNKIGTQFHPEKSQATGLTLIANFLAWQP
ncbi:MAG: imidazole glycerol phosphate synthase subunit HisH [Pseudomonadota bacterium]